MSLRNNIQAATAEFLHLVAKILKVKTHGKDTPTYDSQMKQVVLAHANPKSQLVISEGIFQQIRQEIIDLAGLVKGNSENIESFLHGVRSIFARHKVDEKEYWTDVAIRRYAGGYFTPAPVAVAEPA